jgi:DNA-directed RNA polymerase sigma subunit (sigma70/sigma32)
LPGHANRRPRDLLAEIGNTEPLTTEQEAALAERIREGDREAASLFIRANLRLVANIAQGLANDELPLLDFIVKGNIALMQAVYAFDPKAEGRFQPYAAKRIRESMTV